MTVPKPNGNSLVMAICTFIILAVLGWEGRTTSDTHDKVIALQESNKNTTATILEIKSQMVTHEALSIELLKLQVPATKK